MKRLSLHNHLARLALVWATVVCAAADDTPLADKTLVVWVAPANLTQSGGTALTVNDTTTDRLDGVVFAEIEPQVWMPGSNGYSRTNKGDDHDENGMLSIVCRLFDGRQRVGRRAGRQHG